jgi:hypothetical protein
MSEMRVGVAAVEITPPPGLPLMGNFRDDYLARGSHDPLTAKAIVFEDRRGTKAALLAVDVCMLDRRNVALIRDTIGRTARVPPEHVLVHATHTHSGPAPHDRFLFGLDYRPYRAAAEAMLVTAAAAVAQAERNATEAQLSFGHAHEDRLSFNRRLRRKDGTTQMNWEALAPGFDPGRVYWAGGPPFSHGGCVVILGATGPVAAAVNFGLHPAVLAGDNWLYSADFPGQLSAALRRIQGDDFLTLFLNGCCGNVNHVDYHNQQQGRGYGMIERVGYMLAAAAAQAIRTRVPLAGDDIAVATDMVVLERMPVSPDEYDRCRRLLDDLRKQPLPGQVDGLPEAFFADLRLQMHAVQHEPDHVEVMTIRVGDMAVVGLPGEVFCEFGLELKRRSPTSHTLVVELANDAIGYLPTRESFAQGGYEVTVGSTLYAPGAGERLADAAAAQLQRLF